MTSATATLEKDKNLRKKRPVEGYFFDTNLLIAATARFGSEPGENSKFDEATMRAHNPQQVRGLMIRTIAAGKMIVPRCVMREYENVMEVKKRSNELSPHNQGTYQKLSVCFERMTPTVRNKTEKEKQNTYKEQRIIAMMVSTIITRFHNYCSQNPEDTQASKVLEKMVYSGHTNVPGKIRQALQGPTDAEKERLEKLEAAEKMLRETPREELSSHMLRELDQIIKEYTPVRKRYNLELQSWADAELLALSQIQNSKSGFMQVAVITLDKDLEVIVNRLNSIDKESGKSQEDWLLGRCGVYSTEQTKQLLHQLAGVNPSQLAETIKKPPEQKKEIRHGIT